MWSTNVYFVTEVSCTQRDSSWQHQSAILASLLIPWFLLVEKCNTTTEFSRQLALYSTTDTNLTSSFPASAAADGDQQLSGSCAANRQPNNSSHATSCFGIASSMPQSSATLPSRPRSAIESSSSFYGTVRGCSANTSASAVGGRNYAVGRGRYSQCTSYRGSLYCMGCQSALTELQ